MNNRYKYRLKGEESKSDVNEDSFSQISFNNERRLLPVGEINHVVDLGKEFNKERNSSFIYRLQGTVCPLFSNPLMNPTGTPSVGNSGNGLNIFNNTQFTQSNDAAILDDAIDYKTSYSKNLIEIDGWFGYNDPDTTKVNSLCEFYYIEPGKDKFDLNSSLTNKNWEITITYPYDSDNTHPVVQDGLLIVDVKSVIVGGKPMLALGTSTRHGLENGDKIRLSNAPSVALDNDYTVKRLGLDNGDYIQNYFVIDVDPSLMTTSSNSRIKKIVGGQPSEYYLRKFKKLLINNGDYEMYPLAFSNTIFNDGNYQFVINQDIDVEGLKDNLGRPISELYVTFVKTNSNGMFGRVKSGLDLEFLSGNLSDTQLSNVRRIHNGTTTPVPTHITLPDEDNIYNDYGVKDWFYGDVVEYNKFTLTETVLADVLHRVNTVNRQNATSTGDAKGPRREGYLYKPHYLYQIREFSSYIEQGDSSTDGIPDYAEDLGDGRFLWRDYLDIGIGDGANEGLDYPFTNGAHYLHQNICFMTTRQDPFNNYGLYYGGSEDPFDPADPIGDALTDNFIVKSSQNVC